MEMQEMDRTEVSKYFSDVSRNAGKVVFRITYTATPGNIEVDKQFQEFCFKYANNEYLVGIQLLLQAFESIKKYDILLQMLEDIKTRVTALESKGEQHGMQSATEKEIKTF